MRSNIVLEANGKLSLKNFSLTTPVGIEDLDIYISRALAERVAVYLIIRDVISGMVDIVALEQFTNQFGKPVFRMPIGQQLRINQTTVELKVLIVNMDNGDFSMSDYSSKFKMVTENYQIARETAIVHELSTKVAAYYDAIVKVLQEVVQKGEQTE